MHHPLISEPENEPPHPFMNSDFSKLEPCQCNTSCISHWNISNPTPTNIDTKIKSNETIDDLFNITEYLQDIDVATTKSLGRVWIIRSQNNIGANISVTNNKSSIHIYQDIPSYPVSRVNKGDTAIICEGKGFLIWRSYSNDNLLVPIYFCKKTNGIIISPNSIQQFYKNIYHDFHIYCDCDNKCGEPKFYNKDRINHTSLKSYSHNNIWYPDLPHLTDKPNIS